MSILKDRSNANTTNTSSNTGANKPQTIEELNKLFDTVETMEKDLRVSTRQIKRLGDRLGDLSDAGIDSRALRRINGELGDLSVPDLRERLSVLQGELETNMGAPGNIDANKLGILKRRVTGIQNDIAEMKEIIQGAEETIQAAEDKANADRQKPAAPAESEFTVNTADPSGQMSARLLALQLFPEYKAAGYPPLKTSDGKPVNFAIGVPRGDGSTRFIITDPAATRPEDMSDLVAGHIQKKAFTPLDGLDGLVARELVLLAHTPKLW